MDKPKTIPERLESAREQIQTVEGAIAFVVVEAAVAHMEQELDKFMQEMDDDRTKRPK